MPTYTYECKKCGHTQDAFHSISKSPRIKCDECGGSCKRLLGTGAGVIFKGSGFYETDYKSKGKAGTAKSESGSSESSSSDSAKSESKKSETKASSSKKETAKSD